MNRCALSLTTAIFLCSVQAQSGTTLQIPTLVTPPAGATRGPGNIRQTVSFSPTPDMKSCVPSAFQAPGQAWDVGLTTGGITLKAARYGSAVSEPDFQRLFGVTRTELPRSAGLVYLYIVDHFSPVSIDVRDVTDGPVSSVGIRHGALVEAHIRAVLESAGFAYAGQSNGLVYRGVGKTILIKRVDIDSVVTASQPRAWMMPGSAVRQPAADTALVSSDALAAVLNQKVALPRNWLPTGEPEPMTVLNLSFALLPCDIMRPFRSIQRMWAQASPPQRYTLNAFLLDVGRASHLPPDQVSRLLTQVPDSDPVNGYLAAEMAGGGPKRKVVVASSGNYGLPFTTAPGSGPGVLAVGAKTWGMQAVGKSGGPNANWSDHADTDSVGEWFRLPYQRMLNYCQRGETCISDELTSQPKLFQDFAYRGTSFSAPNVAAFLAVRLDTASSCFEQNPSFPGFKATQKVKPGQRGSDFYGDWLKQECP